VRARGYKSTDKSVDTYGEGSLIIVFKEAELGWFECPSFKGEEVVRLNLLSNILNIEPLT
jgi:hypothetical protein